MMLRLSCVALLSSLLLLASTIPNSRAQTGDDEIVRFSFRFGFFKDDLTPLSEVIKEDVEGVICQTQYFLSQLVQNASGSKSVHAKATEIDWGYFKDQDLPAHLNFTVEFTDAVLAEGDVNWVEDQILITEMEKLETSGLQKFITEWVWDAEPKGLNFFVNANRMSFDGIKQARVEGNLQEAECPETIAPTFAPTISAAPSSPARDIIPPLLGGQGNSPSAANGTDPNGEDKPDDEEADSDAVATANPNGGSPNGGSPNADRPNWPFGANYNDLADLGPMADFSLSFFLFKDHERSPTDSEVNSLLCQVNDFFTAELRRELKNNTIHSKAVYVDYYFNEGGAGAAEDIILNFTAFAYYGDKEHTQIPVNDVFEAMKLTSAELKNFVENYIWKVEPEQENVFYHTESLAVKTGVGGPTNAQAMIVEAVGCILPPAHGESGAIPPPAGAGTPGSTGAVPGGTNQGLGPDAKDTRITTAFRVSNLENIKTMQAVKAEGLDASFPVFVNELVEAMRARDSTRYLLDSNGRRLRVVTVPGSATVTSVQEIDCPGNALPGLTCHEAMANYNVLMSSDEDENSVNNEYTDATNRAVSDGTYNDALQRTVPDTPLFIGIMTNKNQIPPGSQHEDEGWFKWWYILILLLLVLLCCLICLYCSMLRNDKEHDRVKETTIQEREVLVEEFDDDDAPGNDDDEVFVDDEDAGAMVPYSPSPAPAPYPATRQPVVETGVLVPYDPDVEKARADQAARDRILGKH
jgi:hypothetical protein